MADARKYTNRLAGQRVLVIGGSSGIGFGVAEAAIEHGASVIISSSNPERVQKGVARLESSYPSAKGKIQGFACNFQSAAAESEVANLFSKIGGKLDHIVFTAGESLPIKPLEEWKLEDMKQAGAVRFFGPILVAQQCKQYLKEGPGSSLTLTSGGISERPRKEWTVINGYMTGVLGLAKNFGVDLAPNRVNVVAPGAIDTELWDKVRNSGNFEAMKANVAKSVTVGKIGTVEDVAQAYLYLMKDHNVTGQVISSNGGAMLLG